MAIPQVSGGNVKLAAVVELGTTSIRMVIGQIDETGHFLVLDNLQQAVAIGKDTFTKGLIEQETIEECVQALRSFRNALREYGITDIGVVKAIATSAVREATNLDAFLDRIFMATGLNVEVIDEADAGYFTYMAVQPAIEKEPTLKDSNVLVVDVGGGSTEVLMLSQGLVKTTGSYRLGSLRLKKSLEEQRAPLSRLRQIMQSYIEQTMEMLKQQIPANEQMNLVALGGDMRFAASQLQPDWNKKSLVKITVSALSKMTDEIVKYSTDDLVRIYHLAYPEAETLAPALLTFVHLAKALGLKNIFAANLTMRDGVLADMAGGHGFWCKDFKKQIIASAMQIGRKFNYDEPRAKQVADLAEQLFHALQEEHRLGPRHEVILNVAALLHDIGQLVSNRSHHKHSMYLIMNSDIFGMSRRDIMYAALIARYHRRATPRPVHEYYNTLNREERVMLTKLAAILRIADALARGASKVKRTLRISLESRQLTIAVDEVSDLTLEEHALRQKREMFEQVYGMKVKLEG
jgi:exopolyphosphatase/guanosine-5'-triphosphate,3'-diphosphate pyrophosphatase